MAGCDAGFGKGLNEGERIVDAVKRKMVAKIHIARKDLAIEDAAYRALLERVTGRDSCKSMSNAQLGRVLEEFKRLGWSEKPRKRAGSRPMATTEQAGKIRALWLSLYHLGEVRDPSEDALTGYVKRMSGVADLRWLTPRKADAVIKGLRGWCERIGWDVPSGDNTAFYIKYSLFGRQCILALRLEVCPAFVSELEHRRGAATAEWVSNGHDRESELKLDGLIEKLGAEIRRLKNAG